MTHPRVREELVSKIQEAILNDVTDRKGWRHEYDNFDEEIQEDIAATWRDTIRKCLSEDAMLSSAPPSPVPEGEDAELVKKLLACVQTYPDGSEVPDDLGRKAASAISRLSAEAGQREQEVTRREAAAETRHQILDARRAELEKAERAGLEWRRGSQCFVPGTEILIGGIERNGWGQEIWYAHFNNHTVRDSNGGDEFPSLDLARSAVEAKFREAIAPKETS